MQTKTRIFGAIYPTVDFDLAGFERVLGQNGGKLSEKLGFDPADSQGTQQQMATFVGRLKSSGVTSVVLFADPPTVSTIMETATEQDYFPEWIYTGFGYQDYGLFARNNDQQQMAHTFGLGVLGPAVTGSNPSLLPFQWYWGTTRGNTWSVTSGLFEFVYTGVALCGPDADRGERAERAVRRAPAGSARLPNGLVGFGKTVGLPYDAFSLSAPTAHSSGGTATRRVPSRPRTPRARAYSSSSTRARTSATPPSPRRSPSSSTRAASVFQLNGC